jgi:hypothetical protein
MKLLPGLLFTVLHLFVKSLRCIALNMPAGLKIRALHPIFNAT